MRVSREWTSSISSKWRSSREEGAWAIMGKIVERGGSSDKQKSQNSKKCHTQRKVEKGYGR